MQYCPRGFSYGAAVSDQASVFARFEPLETPFMLLRPIFEGVDPTREERALPLPLLRPAQASVDALNHPGHDGHVDVGLLELCSEPPKLIADVGQDLRGEVAGHASMLGIDRQEVNAAPGFTSLRQSREKTIIRDLRRRCAGGPCGSRSGCLDPPSPPTASRSSATRSAD